MPRYRRARIEGGTFFFTVALADRSSNLLVQNIDRLRRVYRHIGRRHPFETLAICVLPDHLHAIWSLPEGDGDFPIRWSLIKGGFSRALAPDGMRSESKIRKREKGIWQRRYWEHLIRSDDDLSRHVDYIHFNPSNTALLRVSAIGRTAAFINSSRGVCCRRIGVVTCERSLANSASES